MGDGGGEELVELQGCEVVGVGMEGVASGEWGLEEKPGMQGREVSWLSW